MRSETPVMRSAPPPRMFPSVAAETVLIFVWYLKMGLRRLFSEDLRALPLPTTLSSRRSTLWCLSLCVCSSPTFEIFRNANNLWRLLCPQQYIHRSVRWTALVVRMDAAATDTSAGYSCPQWERTCVQIANWTGGLTPHIKYAALSSSTETVDCFE